MRTESVICMAKILVVEDEPDLRELVVDQLMDEGHETVEAGNGQEGLDRLAEMTPDLILSDITMPLMDGYEFFQNVKEHHPKLANTPFIYLSALSDREDELKGLRLGVDAYITKPVDFDLLLLRIEAVLRIYNVQRSLAQENDSEPPETEAPLQKQSSKSADDIALPEKEPDPATSKDQPYHVSLEMVRRRFGASWQGASGKILKIVEQLVRRHLGSDDVYSVTPTMDVSIFFADLAPDEAEATIETIGQKIWQHLFGEEMPDMADLEEEGATSNQDPEAAMAAFKRLQQLYTYEDLYFTKLLSASGAPSKIVRLSLNKHFSGKVGHIFRDYQFDSAALIDLQKIIFANLGRQFQDIQKNAKSALVISVSCSIVDDQESRRYYAKHCSALEERLSGLLIIEITETPDHLGAHLKTLEPLPVGRRVQALELRSPEQIADLDMQQLHCSIISMGYEDAVHYARDERLLRFRQGLKRQGIKFFVKDIPEGALNEAQKLKAELYSLQK